MAKRELGMIKLQIPAGKATPAPPVGPALGQHGVNIMDFCKAFNAKTQNQEGLIIPVVITVYQDRSYSFVTKTPPRGGPLEAGSGNRQRFPGAQQGESGAGEHEAGGRDCQDQNA